MKKAITNTILCTGKEMLSGKALLINNQRISAVVNADEIPGDYTLYDGKGHYLSPGFIDLQIYGAGGYLFSAHPSIEAIEATKKYCMQGGANHFLLTLATNSAEVVRRGISVARQYITEGGRGLLGLHLEGPWINPEKRGAHLLEYIHPPTLHEVKKQVEDARGIVKMITLAPERVSEEIIDYLHQQGIVVSAGHSNATYEEALKSFEKIKTVTHLFNAMSPMQSREPGMVGAVYNHPSVYASIVADGVHVHFAAVRVSKKLMGERLFLITDAVTETPEAPYRHVFKKDRYVMPEGTLSGSVLTMMQAVKNCVREAGIELQEALRMATLYPARVLGMEDRTGLIEKNYLASFTVFDKELNWVEAIDFVG